MPTTELLLRYTAPVPWSPLSLPIRAGNRSMGHGSMGQMGHFFDGSHGPWVTSCLPMTHQPQMNSVRRNKNNRLKWIPTVYFAVYCFIKLFGYGLTGRSWVMHNGSRVTFCAAHWVMGHCQWPIACSAANAHCLAWNGLRPAGNMAIGDSDELRAP